MSKLKTDEKSASRIVWEMSWEGTLYITLALIIAWACGAFNTPYLLPAAAVAAAYGIIRTVHRGLVWTREHLDEVNEVINESIRQQLRRR